MAKQQQKRDLAKTLRASGLRDRVARTVADATGRTRKGKTPKVVTSTIENLKSAAAELEDRVGGGASRRSEAAKKGARTRKRKAAARSASARKGAQTRKRTGA